MAVTQGGRSGEVRICSSKGTKFQLWKINEFQRTNDHGYEYCIVHLKLAKMTDLKLNLRNTHTDKHTEVMNILFSLILMILHYISIHLKFYKLNVYNFHMSKIPQ